MKKSKLEKDYFHSLFLFFIILLLPIFLIKEHRIITAKKDTHIFPAQDFFQGQLLENNNKFFTFIILTKNQIEVIDENFASIIQQKYPRYDVVYIDRASIDGTAERIRELIQQHGKKKQIKLIEAKKDYQAFQSYFEEIHKIDNEKVIVHLSGGDILVHEEVLNLVDQAYTNPDVWMTYGQYFEYYSYQKGIYKPKPQKLLCKKKVQRAPWLLASLKTFYAGHFKKIKRQDSMEDYFLSLESEASLLQPLAELGKAHVQFIPDVLYIHNSHKQIKKRKMKLSFPVKEVATTMHESLCKKAEKADVILFSQNHPQILQCCLESVQNKMEGIHQIAIIYQCEEQTFYDYKCIQAKHPHVKFVRQDSQGFKEVFFQTLTDSEAPYVILSSDECILKEKVWLSSCVEAMRKSHAYGFYFHLGQQDDQPSEGIFSWLIKNAEDVWREPNVFKMALYRKIDLERDFKTAAFNNISEWMELWAKQEAPHFGLAFESPKSIPYGDVVN